VARTRTEPLGMVPEVRRQVARVDPDLALTDVRTLQDRLGGSVWRQRLAANVLAALGAAAMLIAVLGVFGIVGFLVGRRTHVGATAASLGAAALAACYLPARRAGKVAPLTALRDE
jgi:hypothetical protein